MSSKCKLEADIYSESGNTSNGGNVVILAIQDGSSIKIKPKTKEFLKCLGDKFRATHYTGTEIGGTAAGASVGGIGLGLGAVPAIKYLMKFFSK